MSYQINTGAFYGNPGLEYYDLEKSYPLEIDQKAIQTTNNFGMPATDG